MMAGGDRAMPWGQADPGRQGHGAGEERVRLDALGHPVESCGWWS